MLRMVQRCFAAGALLFILHAGKSSPIFYPIWSFLRQICRRKERMAALLHHSNAFFRPQNSVKSLELRSLRFNISLHARLCGVRINVGGRRLPFNLSTSALCCQPLPLNVAAKYSDDNQRRDKIEKDFEVCSRSIFCGAHDIRNRFEFGVFIKKQRRLDAK